MLGMCTHRRNHVRTWQEGGTCEPRKEGSEETKYANTLDLTPQECRENKFLLFKPPSLWVFCYGSPTKLTQHINKYIDTIHLTTWRGTHRSLWWVKTPLRLLWGGWLHRASEANLELTVLPTTSGSPIKWLEQELKQAPTSWLRTLSARTINFLR